MLSQDSAIAMIGNYPARDANDDEGGYNNDHIIEESPNVAASA